MSTPLFTLGLCLLTVTVPFLILSLYRILVVVVCFLCGTTVDGVVISKQKNAVSSCLSLHSTHKMMEKRESNYSNIEVWIAYSVGNFNWQVTMVEMSASSYISFPRGKKVNVRYCRVGNCCLRAEPRLTCQRFCGTLVWDRLLDIFLIACVVGGCACCWLSVQTGEDAKLGILAVIPVLTCLCLTCCCHFNLCFLRRNPYKQHVKEVLECDSETLIGSPQKMDRRRSSPGRKQTPSKERFEGGDLAATSVEMKHLQNPNQSANQNNMKADLKAGSKKIELPLKVERNSSFGSVATDYSVMSSDRANYFDIEGTEDVELEIFAATDPVE